MKETNEYLDDLEQKIDSASSENDLDALVGYSDEISEIAQKMNDLCRDMTYMIRANDSEFNGAFDNDIEHLSARALELSKTCNKYIEGVEEEIAEIEKYGSMEDQARSDYYASVL